MLLLQLSSHEASRDLDSSRRSTGDKRRRNKPTEEPEEPDRGTRGTRQKKKHGSDDGSMSPRDELLKSIWHAFTALDVDKSGKVSKSQLKVKKKTQSFDSSVRML